MDIVVTTPKSEMKTAAGEAAACIAAGGGYYLRRLASMPKQLRQGDKVWYVENGYLRGYCIAAEMVENPALVDEATGNLFPAGLYIVMPGESWTRIKPIRFAGFQGWRYFKESEHKIEVVGDWQAPRPDEPSKGFKETNRRLRSILQKDWAGLLNTVACWARTREGRAKWAQKIAALEAELATDVERGIV
jgi:hypothetical protein